MIILIKKELKTNQLGDFEEIVKYETPTLKYGLSLFCELIRVFNYTL
jgi:hypothetical protein